MSHIYTCFNRLPLLTQAPACATTVFLILAVLLILCDDIHDMRYAADEGTKKPILPLWDTDVLHGIAAHRALCAHS